MNLCLIVIICVIIVGEMLFLLMLFNNYRFVLNKYKSDKFMYAPRVVMIVPCKNIDQNFAQNISSFYSQDFDNYVLWFVVADKQDPAYDALCRIKDKYASNTKAKNVQILVSGPGRACSQKIHNLLYAYSQIPGDIEVLAFADSDICVKPNWLNHLIHRLRLEHVGVTTGYRWYVPVKNNFATITLCAVNAKIAQLLGNTIFNQAWGGSMAIKVKTFRELGMDKIWQKAVSDDLSLSHAVKKAHKKVEFVPGCFVTTMESTTWSNLFEFGRRQFVITRVHSPITWIWGLFSSFYSALGLWGGIALLIYAALTHHTHIVLLAVVPVLFISEQFLMAVLREKMASKLFAGDWEKMRIAAYFDIALFWLWSPLVLILILTSAFGRTICWRGIRYKLISQTETVVLDSGK